MAITYVLVHGAWHTGQCWARVVPRLAASGRPVFTPTLTGYGETRHLLAPDVGLRTHAADVVRLLVEADLHDVVLVGHSYAGLVISAVANEVPERIARLVYLDAMVPVHGENGLDVMPVTRSMLGTGWRVPPLPELPAPFGLFGVTDPGDVAWLRTMLSDQPLRCLEEPVELDNPAAAAIPRTHIHCTVKPEGFDRRPVPAVQPNGEPADVRELAAGHDCMITAPAELAGLLLDVGEPVGAGSMRS
ncbi:MULTISPECIES: alpha/beta hydrolase [unclassified Amycolatopsis]|uniref:alpha/beta hydrolase n=1 Tax=unclassified Amycolatopsis TaxID=2618356 RepID=UPI00287623B7|nr:MULTISPECIES: alpha/beta hydrolase [unclassified Amycolatopsis]MDS0134265.1 alpha/beta fold hydrolase [Amycolatopsis sp. 505]MDS0146794.1 alpha/beta fold hydrolase [Amycolatopsis sp. CM201R]